MWIGDHGGGAMCDDSSCKFRRGDHRAFQVDMSINKTRAHEASGHIFFNFALVLANADNFAIRDRNITDLNGFCKYVYNRSIL